MEITPAQPAHWPQIWPIFAAVVEAGETYAYPWPTTSEEAQALWTERPPGLTVVALDGDRVVGTAKAGPNRPTRGSHVATASFMVDPSFQGRGVGRALATYVLEWATERGYRSMQFNAVVETNTAAVHLWQDLGFRILATVPAAFDHRTRGLVGLHVMFRELGAAGPGGERP